MGPGDEERLSRQLGPDFVLADLRLLDDEPLAVVFSRCSRQTTHRIQAQYPRAALVVRDEDDVVADGPTVHLVVPGRAEAAVWAGPQALFDALRSLAGQPAPAHR